MFKIENGYLKFEDFEFKLPEEVRVKTPSKIFGTSTAGLQVQRGVFLEANGVSGRVGLANGSVISGHIYGRVPKYGILVYIREQMDVINPNKTFWIISIKEVNTQINWITVEFTDGTTLKVCPFTEYYNVS